MLLYAGYNLDSYRSAADKYQIPGLLCGVCMFSSCLVFSGWSSFLPHSKDMHVRWSGNCQLHVIVKWVCLLRSQYTSKDLRGYDERARQLTPPRAPACTQAVVPVDILITLNTSSNLPVISSGNSILTLDYAWELVYWNLTSQLPHQ